MNILPAAVQSLDPGACTLAWAEGAPPIRAACEPGLGLGQTVKYAVRPEKIEVTDTPSDAYANRLKGRIVDIGYVGNISTYHVEVAPGTIFKAQTTNARRLSRRDFTWEDEVWLGWTETAGLVLER